MLKYITEQLLGALEEATGAEADADVDTSLAAGVYVNILIGYTFSGPVARVEEFVGFVASHVTEDVLVVRFLM